MKAYQLSQNFETKFKFSIKDKIGEGADGDCYTLTDNPEQVVKFSVYYCWNNEDTNQVIADRLAGYKQISDNPHLFAKLYDYGFVGKGTRSTVIGPQEYIIFYCLMEKLESLSEDEKKVFHSILSHEDNNLKKNYSLDKVKKMLQGLSMGLTFNDSRVINFVTKVKQMNVGYTDIHPRNIMKDNFGDYKFIDFDRITV